MLIAVIIVLVLCCVSNPLIAIAGFVFAFIAMVLQVLFQMLRCMLIVA